MKPTETSKFKQYVLLLTIFLVIFTNYLLLIGPERWQSNDSELKSNKSMPPSLVLITVALGPIRGLIADALWWHVAEMQEKSEYFEIIKITDWITAMQPKNPYVWTYHAWNLAYNIAYEFPTAETRWGWINKGIKLLRDEGLKYNPNSNFIKSELAFMLVDRVSGVSDNQDHYYVKKWSEEMGQYMQKGNRQEIQSMLTYMQKNPDFEQEKNPLARKIDALTSNMKLKPEKMWDIDKQYGPFNWFLPQASAVYWGVRTKQKEYSQGYLNYKVVLPVAMQQAFLRGAIVENPKTGLFITTNNFAIAPNIIRMYKEKAKNSKKPHIEHANCLVFLRSAIPLLVSFNETKLANELFADYKAMRPGLKVELQDFYGTQMLRLHEKGAARYKQSIVEIPLFNAFRMLLAKQPGKAYNFVNIAEKEWQKHQQRYGSSALRLPPMDQIKVAAFCKAYMLTKTPQQKKQLMMLVGPPQAGKLHVQEINSIEFNGKKLSEIK